MYLVRFAIAISVSTDAKTAMDFNRPCSKGCSPVWICHERYSYCFFVCLFVFHFCTTVSIEIWVQNTCRKVVQRRKQRVPNLLRNWGPRIPIFMGGPQNFMTPVITKMMQL